jgi:hypothetical protein
VLLKIYSILPHHLHLVQHHPRSVLTQVVLAKVYMDNDFMEGVSLHELADLIE